MAYYYVKSGGTATGDGGRYTSQQTGGFSGLGASGYYDSLNDAFNNSTTAPSAGDFVLVSDLHSKNYGGVDISLNAGVTNKVCLISVSDSDITVYSAGAVEDSGGTNNDYRLSGFLTTFGMTLKCSDDFSINSASATITAIESDFRCGEGSGDRISASLDGIILRVVNGTIAIGDHYNISGGSSLEAYNCTVDANAGGNFFQGAGNGGFTAQIIGSDLSSISGNLLNGIGGNRSSDDLINVEVRNCLMSPTVVFADEDFAGYHLRLKVYNSSSDSAAAEYQFYERGFGGEVEDQDDAGIHRGESTAFPGGEKVSAKVTTNADAETFNPFYFDLITTNADLSSASSDVITIYFASTTSLDDNEVWAELIYPDGTNKHTPNFLSNRNSNPLAAGTAHTDDSGSSTWKDGVSDLTGYNEYRMTLDTSSDSGADCVPIIRIYCGVASAIIYFDTTVGLS